MTRGDENKERTDWLCTICVDYESDVHGISRLTAMNRLKLVVPTVIGRLREFGYDTTKTFTTESSGFYVVLSGFRPKKISDEELNRLIDKGWRDLGFYIYH